MDNTIYFVASVSDCLDVTYLLTLLHMRFREVEQTEGMLLFYCLSCGIQTRANIVETKVKVVLEFYSMQEGWARLTCVEFLMVFASS